MQQVPPLALAACTIGATMLLVAFYLAKRTPPLEKKPLMTRRERAVAQIIERSFPRLRVHCQVSMGALLQPKRNLSARDQETWRWKYSQKIVDYVLEDRGTGEVVALVELDDWSHEARRDAARDRLTRAAGYLTVRLPADERPTSTSVQQRIGQALGGERRTAGARPALISSKGGQHGLGL